VSDGGGFIAFERLRSAGSGEAGGMTSSRCPTRTAPRSS
jgi:hypothetical protein